MDNLEMLRIYTMEAYAQALQETNHPIKWFLMQLM